MDAPASPPPRRQAIAFAGIFAGVVALLAAGYFLVLRPGYVAVFSGLRASDAAAIKAELDKAGRDYRLGDEGATILVREDEADAVRLEVAGSEAGERGLVGLELFNKSDMGLTNFAQKINYQRALQGELVRTITRMDRVESARVHLALPDRSVFRGEQQAPSAAVTVAMKPGTVADPGRIAGIQRLVAAAVPDLPAGNVVVLDHAGRIVSAQPASPADDGEDIGGDDERSAVVRYYRARLRTALAQALPRTPLSARVLVLADEPAPLAETRKAPGGEAGRNYRLRVILTSQAPLAGEERRIAHDAAAAAIGADPALGDAILFDVVPAISAAAIAPATVPVPATAPAAAEAGPALWPWWLALAALVAVVAIGWRRWRAGTLDPEQHKAFAEHLRRQLALNRDDDHVAG